MQYSYILVTTIVVTKDGVVMVDLLQRVGLNKYEAEAYAALLRHGPLTGYELGKRSDVPLSRSYEILERLAGKGLALVQPGDPPHYAAEPPEQFLDRTRTATTTTLDALARALVGATAASHTGAYRRAGHGQQGAAAAELAGLGAAQTAPPAQRPARESHCVVTTFRTHASHGFLLLVGRFLPRRAKKRPTKRRRVPYFIEKCKSNRREVHHDL